MAKNQYKVVIQEVTTSIMYIDAENEQEAKTEALNRFNNGDSGYLEDSSAYIQYCVKDKI